MKSKIISIAFITITMASLSMSFKRDPKNPPTQSTGAPGEKTCQQSGCHNGGTYVGKVELTGIPDSVVANEVYFVTVTGTSATAVRGGFQMTSLDAKTNVAAGTLLTGVNSNIGTVAGKQYIRQANYQTYMNGKISWTFRWKAPATPIDSVKFYYVALLGNGNGKESGDNVVQGSKKTVFKKSVATIDADEDNIFVKMPSTLVNELLHLQIPENEGKLWIYDSEGKMMQSQTLTADNQIDVNNLARGIYVVIVKVGNKTVSKRFVKQ